MLPAKPVTNTPVPAEDLALQRNQAYLRPGIHVYNTALSSPEEQAFRQWVQQNQVAFNPDVPVSDYDMRGFWKALQAGDPRAMSAVDPNDNRLHYPDYWKTPLHRTFSAESQWANPATAPRWVEDQLVTPDGRVLFDDRVHGRSREPRRAKPIPSGEGMIGQ